MNSDRRINSFQISADSQRVVYIANAEHASTYELYSVRMNGSDHTKVSGDLPDTGIGVISFAIAPTLGVQKVVYTANATSNHDWELFVNVIDDITPPEPIELSNIPHDPGLDYRQVLDFAITSDSLQVVYTANQDLGNFIELYSTSISGVTPVKKLSGTLGTNVNVDRFAITPDNNKVVWQTEYDNSPNSPPFLYNLYGNLIDGSELPPDHLDDLPSGRTIMSGPTRAYFDVTPNNLYAIYIGDQNTLGKNELYAHAISGTMCVRLSSATMQADGDVFSFIIDGNLGVAYRGDQETEGIDELYFKAVAGGPPVKLNLPVTDPAGDVISYKISPDGLSVVYKADLAADGQNELFVSYYAYPVYMPVVQR